MTIYLVGSLKDPDFPQVAKQLREAGHDVFDDWRGAGHDGDIRWRDYELFARDRGYVEALFSPFAVHNRNFDTENLLRCSALVAVCKHCQLPGRSSIAELAFARNHKIKTYVLLNGNPEDWDLMLPLVVDNFFYTVTELLEVLK